MTQKELRSEILRKAGRYVWDAREWGGWARSFSVHDDLSGLSGGESDAVASAHPCAALVHSYSLTCQ